MVLQTATKRFTIADEFPGYPVSGSMATNMTYWRFATTNDQFPGPNIEITYANLNRTLPLRFAFNDCLKASLNWSSGYTCSTAAESDPSATRSPSFW